MCKASKRLHILRVLKRAGLSDQLTKTSLAGSVLEYCCVTWSNNIPEYLSQKIERIQKRAMRIIFQNVHYDDALVMANCQRLDDRRSELCMRMLDKDLPRLHHLHACFLLLVRIVIHMSYEIIIQIFAYEGVERTDIKTVLFQQ